MGQYLHKLDIFPLYQLFMRTRHTRVIFGYPKTVLSSTSFGRTGGQEEKTGAKYIPRVVEPKIRVAMYEAGARPKFTVCVEGNIGSGKSTLLKHFSQYRDVQVLEEPVNKWRNVQGHNLLDLMYKDPCRWAHTFQSYVQMTMMELHLRTCVTPVKLIERSLYSARFCFVENLYQNKKISDPEFNVYCEWYKLITQNMDVGVDLIVYLRTDPSVVHERIRKRARSEEQTIPLQYLEDLHKLHEEWLTDNKHPLPAPVLVLDANDNLPTMYKKFEKHTSDILCKTLIKSYTKECEASKSVLPPTLTAAAI